MVDSYIYREPLLDQDVLASNDRALSPPKYPGLNSHVLLSACKEGEVAKENDARGAFTKALLVVLQGDITGMTYSDILDRMDPLPGYVQYKINLRFLMLFYWQTKSPM